MSRKELPRAGLVQAALAGKITNRKGAVALHLTPRQFQRLKRRVREGGPLALRHQSRGRPSRRRLPVAVAAQVQALLRDYYAGFNDTHLTEKLREIHIPNGMRSNLQNSNARFRRADWRIRSAVRQPRLHGEDPDWQRSRM